MTWYPASPVASDLTAAGFAFLLLVLAASVLARLARRGRHGRR